MNVTANINKHLCTVLDFFNGNKIYFVTRYIILTSEVLSGSYLPRRIIEIFHLYFTGVSMFHLCHLKYNFFKKCPHFPITRTVKIKQNNIRFNLWHVLCMFFMFNILTSFISRFFRCMKYPKLVALSEHSNR